MHSASLTVSREKVQEKCAAEYLKGAAVQDLFETHCTKATHERANQSAFIDFFFFFLHISHKFLISIRDFGKPQDAKHLQLFLSSNQSVAFKEIVHKLHFLYCCSQCILTGEL